EVEHAKIRLSDGKETELPLGFVEAGLKAPIRRQAFEAHTSALGERIAEHIRRCLKSAGVGADQIDAVFLTGGSTRIPHVRAAILGEAPEARVVEGDIFGAVGAGLTIEAARRYG
ncbi:Hsp70 family protein, partial [Hansschlegelia quercus]|uniref:Hsp70 family protein n=1 Tax=Hansschlegelia quercus TaxID=2528245 RepID=UPI003608608C